MRLLLVVFSLYVASAFAEINDVSNNVERISFYLSTRGEDPSTQLYSLRGRPGRKTDITSWGYTNAVPVEADLPSSSVASSWTGGNDTTNRAVLKDRPLEELVLLQLIYTSIRKGQVPTLTTNQFRTAIRDAVEQAKRIKAE